MLQTLVALKMFASRLMDREDGAAAIEYGLIAGLIALAIVVGAGALGTEINNLFNRVATQLQNTGVN